MNQTLKENIRIIKIISIVLSAMYIIGIIILLYTNDLFIDIYDNNNWIELSFILFITYLILYIKDAFVSDFIELVIEKKEKAFLPHLLEHSLEPFILFLFFLLTTRILLLLNMDSMLPKILMTILTPSLYFILKKKLHLNKKGTS